MMAAAENQDHLIMKQKEALEKEIADSIALVGEMEDIVALEKDFANDQVYLRKAKALSGKYCALRRTRPDGNCFFRAVAFRHFETMMSDEKEWKRFKDSVVVPSKDQMTELGFPSFTVEDFCDTFLEQLDKVRGGDFSSSDLLQLFNDQGVSDYLVVFLRLLTSKHLQEKADFFQAFIGDCRTVKDFCGTDVEPMYVESDNIHVSALTAAAGVKVRIMYLDRSGAGADANSDADADSNGGGEKEAKAHDFPDEGGRQPDIHLLYRPGHYDVLYPKDD